MKRTKLRWSARAERNLHGIRSYIAQDDPETADSFLSRLRRAVSRLRRFPESGWVVAEFNLPDVREIVFQSYRVVYRYDGERVVILTVFHGAYLLRHDVLDD